MKRASLGPCRSTAPTAIQLFYTNPFGIWLFFLLLLYLLRKTRYQTGDIAAVYFFAYSLGRCFIEPLRTDSLMLGSIRMAVVMSVLGMLAGVVLYFYNRKHPVAKV